MKQDYNRHNPLNENDIRVLKLLSSGSYSVMEITNTLNIPDPRSNIRYLRNAGYTIGDYWEQGKYTKHKVYFMEL